MVLTCILTDDERRARGIEIGACVEKLEESEDEFKAVKSRFDREKKELTGKIRDLSRATRTGEEMRTVNCQKIYDYANSRVYWIREDLQEIFKERPMHEDEKQFELFKAEPEGLADQTEENAENVKEFFHASEIAEVSEEGAKILDEAAAEIGDSLHDVVISDSFEIEKVMDDMQNWQSETVEFEPSPRKLVIGVDEAQEGADQTVEALYMNGSHSFTAEECEATKQAKVGAFDPTPQDEVERKFVDDGAKIVEAADHKTGAKLRAIDLTETVANKKQARKELDAQIAKVKNEWWFNYPVPGDEFKRGMSSITCEHLARIVSSNKQTARTQEAADLMIAFRIQCGTWEEPEPKKTQITRKKKIKTILNPDPLPEA